MLAANRIPRARARDLRLVGLVLLAAQLLSFAHLFFVRHVTCTEHGDIMHVEHAHGQAHDPSALNRDVPLRPSLEEPPAGMGAEHSHCLVCAEANRRCLLTGPAQACAAPVFEALALRASTHASFAPIDLLILSPKNSPPSA